VQKSRKSHQKLQKIQIEPPRPLLDRLYGRYHRVEFLGSDPLEFPHRYRDAWDQEAVALLSALLAYGNVKQIRRSVEAALAHISTLASSPQEFVRAVGTPSGVEAALVCFQPFIHRFNQGIDLVILFSLLSKSWSQHGSLGAHFVSYLEPQDENITRALDALIADWRAWIQSDPILENLGRKSPSFSYFLTAPRDGSCCKRWCMFLRWMGRQDDEAGKIDLGLWAPGSELALKTFPVGRALHATQLVIPLDTHTGRISQYLALTERKSLNWLAALEVTQSLRGCDAQDPTKYDFALARLGILALCKRKYRSEICSKCDLLEGCRFAKSRLP
jgi:uncharacterized protein (TIGR02757 family)